MNRLIAVLAIVLVSTLWWLFPPGVRAERVLRLQPVVVLREPLRVEHTAVRPIVPVVVAADLEPMPASSYRYRRMIELAAKRAFPYDPPVALLAAQVGAESDYTDAVSSAGASGLAQFMPATARLMAVRYPELWPANPRDPGWALRAQALHMRDLFDLYPVASTCNRWALTLGSYNGPPQLIAAERAQAKNPNVWFGSVETVRVRGRGIKAFNENRGYVRRILLKLEPRYTRAGWSGGLGCDA